MLENVPTFDSMNDIGMDFIKNPELTFSDSGLVLESDVAVSLFELYDPVNPKQDTLLNPIAVHQFYYDYHF